MRNIRVTPVVRQEFFAPTATRMTVKLVTLRPADLARVDISLPADLNYWTRVLGVSELELLSAVEAVGDSSWNVRVEVRRRRTQ